MRRARRFRDRSWFSLLPARVREGSGEGLFQGTRRLPTCPPLAPPASGRGTYCSPTSRRSRPRTAHCPQFLPRLLCLPSSSFPSSSICPPPPLYHSPALFSCCSPSLLPSLFFPLPYLSFLFFV